MVVVDTSVWVAVLRSRDAPEAATLAALIDADEVTVPVLVRIELLSGSPSRDRRDLRRRLAALTAAYPDDDTWALVDSWLDRASAAGLRFGVGDLVIAALAAERGALVWSLDRDFERMEKVGLVKLYN